MFHLQLASSYRPCAVNGISCLGCCKQQIEIKLMALLACSSRCCIISGEELNGFDRQLSSKAANICNQGAILNYIQRNRENISIIREIFKLSAESGRVGSSGKGATVMLI